MSRINFLFPNRCRYCDKILEDTNALLCITCVHNLPFTHDLMNNKSVLYKKLRKLCPVEEAVALLVYNNKNISKALLHHNKYFGQDYIGKAIAELCQALVKNKSYTAVLPVPSHAKTIRKRGYNQVELFARTIAKFSGSGFNDTFLIRKNRHNSQAGKSQTKRLKSLTDSFVFNNHSNELQHYLIVDDVCTTGATIQSCVKAIHREGLHKVSVLTMASVE